MLGFALQKEQECKGLARTQPRRVEVCEIDKVGEFVSRRRERGVDSDSSIVCDFRNRRKAMAGVSVSVDCGDY